MKTLQRLPPAGVSARIPQIDGIRGIAILLVLIWHYVVSKVDPSSGPLADFVVRFLTLTWSGVDLFFVLSGFLIGGILLDHRDASNYFKAFYVRRICRIFPLYFAWLLLFFLLLWGVPALTTAPALRSLFDHPLPLWSYATFTQNFAMAIAGTMGPEWLGATWSLAIEEQFYLLLPLMVRLIAPRWLPHTLVTLIVAAPIFRMLAFYVPPHSAFPNYVLTPARADALLLGVFAAYLVREKNAAQWLADHTRSLYLALSVLLLGVISLSLVSTALWYLVVNSYGYTWLALLYAFLILIAVTEKQGIVTRLTTTPALRQLGVLAYSTYLFHQTVNALAHGLLLNHAAQLQTAADALVSLGALALTLLAAYLSWTFYEKKIVAWGHSYAYRGAEGRTIAQSDCPRGTIDNIPAPP